MRSGQSQSEALQAPSWHVGLSRAKRAGRTALAAHTVRLTTLSGSSTKTAHGIRMLGEVVNVLLYERISAKGNGSRCRRAHMDLLRQPHDHPPDLRQPPLPRQRLSPRFLLESVATMTRDYQRHPRRRVALGRHMNLRPGQPRAFARC
jgi:hypothetical protein